MKLKLNQIQPVLNKNVKFALEKYSVKAEWKIIPLTYDKWMKFSKEKTSLNKLAWKLENELKKLLESPEVEEWLEKDEELKRKLYRGFEMEKEIEREYGRVLTLEENLASDAIILKVRPPLKKLKKLRGKFPFYYKLLKKHKDKDFLILMNAQLIPEQEILKAIVHETLHYIQNLRKTRTDFQSIEDEADSIVDEFVG